ncbi:hypothetical protein CJP72_14635 [Citrobacter sp. NCU1]|uniref:aldose epimerase family protein n=1 Tax=Citrobacter sp. NCU1 TaxID=2026683 RepID=UPI001390B6E8|nr:aldose 1-epimerase [Citrobacter sp. NCU1]NDO81953.1 hypothetical protein [Citrobacter sp. NCU1]
MTEHFIRLQQDFATDWPGPVGPVITLSNQDLTLSIYPDDGCRIRSMQAFGMETLRPWEQGKRAFQYGCFPMVPWVGRVENGVFYHEGIRYQLPQNKFPHAMHGIACMQRWEVLYATKTQALFRIELSDPWPFTGSVLYEVRLEGNNVIMKLSIFTAERAFPASAGWHPWFKKQLDGTEENQLLITFRADWQEEPGTNEVPTGKRVAPGNGPWDDTFGFNCGANVSLYWGSKLTLNISSTGHYLTVFDKQPDATCVNTLTDRPNGINSHQVNLTTPDQPTEITSILTFTRGIA